jgi:hypothetical protein
VPAIHLAGTRRFRHPAAPQFPLRTDPSRAAGRLTPPDTDRIIVNPLRSVSRRAAPWGYSSAGRALRWQRRGQGFKSPYLHHHFFSGLGVPLCIPESPRLPGLSRHSESCDSPIPMSNLERSVIPLRFSADHLKSVLGKNVVDVGTKLGYVSE